MKLVGNPLKLLRDLRFGTDYKSVERAPENLLRMGLDGQNQGSFKWFPQLSCETGTLVTEQTSN